MKSIFILHFAVTFCLIGLIWFIQLVHYPLLGEMTKYRANAYDKTHMRTATWVLAPPMLLEMITGLLLIWHPLVWYPLRLACTGLALLILIWLSTAFLQAPKHEILASKYVERTHRALIATNRIRVAGWTLRGILLLYALSMAP